MDVTLALASGQTNEAVRGPWVAARAQRQPGGRGPEDGDKWARTQLASLKRAAADFY